MSRKWEAEHRAQFALSQNRGTYEEGKEKENSLSLANLAGTHLLAVMVRGTRRAVEIVRVKTGPPHIGLAHLCLV